MNKGLVITHKNCVDGCTAKHILMKHYRDEAQYLELEHSDFDKDKFPEKYSETLKTIEQFKNSKVIMADIVVSPDLIDTLLDNKNEVVILDHHHTVSKMIKDYQNKIEKNEMLNMSIRFSEDNSQSGAMLTWNYLYPQIEAPDFVKYVCDGDRWSFKYAPQTQYMYAGLLDEKQPKDITFNDFEDLFNHATHLNDLIEKGGVIRQQYMNEVNSLAQQAIPIKLFGHEGYFIKASMKYKSELGAQLASYNKTFGLIIEERPEEGLVACSLRSVGAFDVSIIAKHFNGGGHTKASAFRVKNLEEFSQILIEHGNPPHIAFETIKHPI